MIASSHQLTASEFILLNWLMSKAIISNLHLKIIYTRSRHLMLALMFVGVSVQSVKGQTSSESLWKKWKDTEETDSNRLVAINNLIWQEYLFSDPDSGKILSLEAITFAKEKGIDVELSKAQNNYGISFHILSEFKIAMEIYSSNLLFQRKIGYKKGESKTLNNIGSIHFYYGNYDRALEYYNKCLMSYEEIADSMEIANTYSNIGIVYETQGNRELAISYFEKSIEIKRLLGSSNYGNPLHALGDIYADLGQYEKALEYQFKGLEIREGYGYKTSIAGSYLSIGETYYKMGNFELAMEYYQKSIALSEEVSNLDGLAEILVKVSVLLYDQSEYNSSISYGKRALELAIATGAKQHIQDASKSLYNSYKELNENKLALEMHELYIQIRDSISSTKVRKEILRQEFEYSYQKKAFADSLEFSKKNEIKDLELQKKQADINNQRIALASTIGGIMMLIILAFTVYRGKQRSDKLLLNILPEETAKELKETGNSKAKLFDQVSVLFTDFVDFTTISQELSPEVLVEEINICFSQFDRIMDKFDIEKIKTIGDAYMAVGGLPTPNTDNARSVVQAALEIRDFIKQRSIEQRRKGLPYFEIRIGVHSGPVVAGIVGTKKFQYDVWGDTVNTASRLESSSEAGKVNVSKTVHDLLSNEELFDFEFRAKIETKGKGFIEMYYVEESLL